MTAPPGCEGFLIEEQEALAQVFDELMLKWPSKYVFVYGTDVHGPYDTEWAADHAGRIIADGDSFLIDRLVKMELRRMRLGVALDKWAKEGSIEWETQ